MTKTLAGLAMLAIGWALSAWLLMLLIGTVHTDWLPVVPAIGYPTALVLTVLLGTRALIAAGVAAFFQDLANNGTRR